MEGTSIKKLALSALVGAVGFAIGFYAGFFALLEAAGLSASGTLFTVVTGGAASLLAGSAIALTVSDGRRVHAVLTAVGLGLALVAVMLALDADAGAMAVGGLILVVATALLVRTGTSSRILARSE